MSVTVIEQNERRGFVREAMKTGRFMYVLPPVKPASEALQKKAA